jgi:hypothetical protein
LLVKKTAASNVAAPAKMVLNVPIHVFSTRDLAFYATVVEKEGMDKVYCHWCKLPSSQWPALGYAPGIKSTLQELKQVTSSLNDRYKEIREWSKKLSIAGLCRARKVHLLACKPASQRYS